MPTVARCQTPTTPLFALATQGGTPLATSYAPNAPFTPGSVYAAGPWIPSTSITASISGLAGVSSNVYLGVASVGSVEFDGTSVGEVPVNGSITASLLAPRSAPALYVYAAPQSMPNGMGKHEYIASVPVNATQAALVDPGLPWVAQGLSNGTTFAWQQTSGVYDAASVVMTWAHVDSTSTAHFLTWSLIMPAGMTSFDWFPTLPAELDAFKTPENLEGGYAGPAVTLVDFSDAATYDAALAKPEWAFELPIGAVTYGGIEGGVAVAHGP
jgi:hypothetical protein